MSVTVNKELQTLAEILAEWAAPAPGVNVYLFGSRVRGDHKPGSDVDVRLYPEEWPHDASQRIVQWWTHQNETEFADLEKRLPGPLHLGRDKMDHGHVVDREIMTAVARPP
jgi:predicted nucleotidyltransferase